MFNRRHFLGASLASTAVYAAGSFVPAWAQNAPNVGTPVVPSPGFRRIKVGEVEVIALTDGVARRPLGEEFVRNAPLEQVKAIALLDQMSSSRAPVAALERRACVKRLHAAGAVRG